MVLIAKMGCEWVRILGNDRDVPSPVGEGTPVWGECGSGEFRTPSKVECGSTRGKVTVRPRACFCLCHNLDSSHVLFDFWVLKIG